MPHPYSTKHSQTTTSQVDDPAENNYLGKVCQCDDGWGDYGCNMEVPEVPTGEGGSEFTQDVSLDVGEWEYFRVTVSGSI